MLQSFITENDIILSKIIIHSDKNSHSIISTDALEINDIVLQIPKSCILSIKTTAIADIIQENQISGTLGLSFALMYEKSLGLASPWHDYIQTLPEFESIPLLWSKDDQINLLTGTDLDMKFSNDYDTLLEDYNGIILPIINSCKSLFTQDVLNKLNFNAFLNACSLVSSRAFQVDAYHEHAMVPLADLFNHKINDENVHFESDPNVCENCGSCGFCECMLYSEAFSDNGSEQSWESDESLQESDDSNSCPSLEIDDDHASISSDEDSDDSKNIMEFRVVKPCMANEQVFNTYGYHPNSYLLNRYGFCQLENDNDMVNVSMEQILCHLDTLSKSLIQKRIQFWNKTVRLVCIQMEIKNTANAFSEDHDNEDVDSQEEEFIDDDQDNFYFDYNGNPSLQLLLFIRLMIINDAAFKSLRSPKHLKRAITQLLNPEKFGNSIVNQAIKNVILLIIKDRLKKYPSTLEKDLEILETATGPLKWALILRISEQQILKKAIL